MAKCDLLIVIDQGKDTFRVGETVSGRVQVSVDSDCRCNGLSIERLWATHGRGNRTSGGKEEQVLFQGEWRAGEQHSYPFSFAIPPGPVTYHGHYLNVDFYLRAQADIPWAFDPKAERELVVLPPEDPGALAVPSPEPTEGFDQVLQTVNAFGGNLVLIFGGVFFLVGLGVLIPGALLVGSKGTIGLPPLLFGVVFSLVGGFIGYMAIRNRLAEKKLGPVLLKAEPVRLGPGESVALSLRFTPRARANLNRITATLQGKEVVVSGSGTNRTTHTHTLHTETRELHSGGDLFPGEEQDLAETLSLPADAPFSFSAPSNQLVWSLTAHIDVAGWPDWSQSVPLVVTPYRASSASLGG
ncbi:MAG: hypothetical protein D6731_06895 [Planctomycetota bacterium]|nr:MAG: hypothetical protein D6731_06895 [Planctomycetota bacterium]